MSADFIVTIISSVISCSKCLFRGSGNRSDCSLYVRRQLQNVLDTAFRGVGKSTIISGRKAFDFP